MSDLLEIIDNKKIEFEHSGKKFIYDFNELSLEQAEMCREIGTFKLQQVENAVDVDVQKFINSKGAEWRLMLLSYLILEVRGEKVLPFERSKIPDYEKFIKGIKMIDYKKMEAAIDDFFTNIGLSPITSILQQSIKRKQTIETLLPLLMKTQMTL
jgi:hypothetical protein